MTDDTIISRIRKLFAKAESTEFGPESEALTAKAFELLARHDLTEADLIEVDNDYGRRIIQLDHFGNAAHGACSLVVFLHRLQGAEGGIRVWNDLFTGKRRAESHVWATDSQHERAMLFVNYLLPQMRADLIRDKPRSRKSFSLGWASRVHQRLQELQQTAYDGTNLPVPTTTAANRAMTDDLGGRPRNTGDYDVDARSYTSGIVAGGQADLNQERITPQQEVATP